eukprot:TRINITY_DN220_c0_g1_i2.p2 TRINITY_DN220_c0_g1~~TRINITY_DN220_c0_g1_i2.p2  ORF type:complete len:227 (+),score=-5.33 TRINITY_DN220_c0_g1_i2:224-904(+)
MQSINNIITNFQYPIKTINGVKIFILKSVSNYKCLQFMSIFSCDDFHSSHNYFIANTNIGSAIKSQLPNAHAQTNVRCVQCEHQALQILQPGINVSKFSQVINQGNLNCIFQKNLFCQKVNFCNKTNIHTKRNKFCQNNSVVQTSKKSFRSCGTFKALEALQILYCSEAWGTMVKIKLDYFQQQSTTLENFTFLQFNCLNIQLIHKELINTLLPFLSIRLSAHPQT